MCYIGSWVSLLAVRRAALHNSWLDWALVCAAGAGQDKPGKVEPGMELAPNSIAHTINHVGRDAWIIGNLNCTVALISLVLLLHRVSPTSRHPYWRICIGPIECRHVHHDARRDSIRCRTTVFDCSSRQRMWVRRMYRWACNDQRCLLGLRRRTNSTSIRIRFTCKHLHHARRLRRTR